MSQQANSRSVSSLRLGVATLVFSSAFGAPAQAPPPATLATSSQIHIRVVNAQTNKPVTNERLNVSLHTEQIGFTVLPTDKDGIVQVDPRGATIVHLLANFYADCRPRSELYRNYSIDAVRSTGITTGNLCSHIAPAPKPGELLLFVIPKTYIPTMGQPPATSLPHSDENPNLH